MTKFGKRMTVQNTYRLPKEINDEFISFLKESEQSASEVIRDCIKRKIAEFKEKHEKHDKHSQ